MNAAVKQMLGALGALGADSAAIEDPNKPAIGTRVVALDESDDNQVTIFGYGEYAGDEVPSEDAIGDRSLMARMLGMKIPKIKLDDGQFIYASETHWGPEEGFKEFVGTRELKTLSIAQVRKKFHEEHVAHVAAKELN